MKINLDNIIIEEALPVGRHEVVLKAIKEIEGDMGKAGYTEIIYANADGVHKERIFAGNEWKLADLAHALGCFGGEIDFEAHIGDVLEIEITTYTAASGKTYLNAKTLMSDEAQEAYAAYKAKKREAAQKVKAKVESVGKGVFNMPKQGSNVADVAAAYANDMEEAF